MYDRSVAFKNGFEIRVYIFAGGVYIDNKNHLIYNIYVKVGAFARRWERRISGAADAGPGN